MVSWVRARNEVTRPTYIFCWRSCQILTHFALGSSFSSYTRLTPTCTWTLQTQRYTSYVLVVTLNFNFQSIAHHDQSFPRLHFCHWPQCYIWILFTVFLILNIKIPRSSICVSSVAGNNYKMTVKQNHNCSKNSILKACCFSKQLQVHWMTA